MDRDVVEIPPPIHKKPSKFKKQKQQVSNYSSFSIQSFHFYLNFHLGFHFKVMIIFKVIAFDKILLLFLCGKLGSRIHV
jgi:hypothetical protein